MSDERPNNAEGVKCEEEQLNADGQTARKVTNTTGEYSVERAREAFDRALGGKDDEAGSASAGQRAGG